MFRIEDYLNLEQTAHASLFDACGMPWDALKKLEDYLSAISFNVDLSVDTRLAAFVGENVSIGEGTRIEAGAVILGPAVIGRNCQIRHGAYIRSNVIVGDGCVVGHGTELKQCLLFNQVMVPHMNYAGDAIFGFCSHLGAGAKISNVKWNNGVIRIDAEATHGQKVETGLMKLGAIIGDHVEIGCNAVVSPGSVLGRHSVIYPNVLWRGVLPAHKLVKNLAQQSITDRLPDLG